MTPAHPLAADTDVARKDARDRAATVLILGAVVFGIQIGRVRRARVPAGGTAVACALAMLALAASTSSSTASSAPPVADAATAGHGAFSVARASVTPRHAYVAGRVVRIVFAIDTAAPAPLALRVEIVREATGRPVRTFTLDAVAPGVEQRLEWDAVVGGEGAPDGAYRVRAISSDGTRRRIGATFTLHSHAYPIRGPHADRGPIGAFGVPRNGGRTHEGFDVNAPCGTPIVAARGGRVERAVYDPILYGNLVIIRGARTHRDYWYAHMKHATRLHVGDRVLTGERIGSIGATGNARTIGCHLHFEIHVGGVPVDPAPQLHAWDAWS